MLELLGICDPGEEIIKKAIEENIKIIPIPGACAFVKALIISGIDTKELMHLQMHMLPVLELFLYFLLLLFLLFLHLGHKFRGVPASDTNAIFFPFFSSEINNSDFTSSLCL